MKKILAFLLTATLLCAMFVIPSAADDFKNYEAEVPFVSVAPAIDGKVGGMEYGTALPMHSYDENPEQFSTTNDFDAYDNWNVEFYAAYDADKLYMAWIVDSDIHAGLPKTDFSADGKFDEGDYGYMWQYSCIQFILTPGNPASGENYAGNFLEVGLCLLEDGEQARVAWNLPAGVEKDDISINDWDAAIVRDEAAGTTTYEIAIPKAMSGIANWGSEAQFGLSYAAAAQEDFNVKNGMLEWQDAILGNNGKKQPNNCAVMTLAKSDVQQGAGSGLGLQPGELPADAADAVQIEIDKINTSIQGNDCVLVTDLTMAWDYDTQLCTNFILAPIEGGEEGEYEVIDRKVGDGTNVVVYDKDIEGQDGNYLIISVNGTDEIGQARLDAANTIGEGSVVKLFGVDLTENKVLYSNAMIYVTDLVDPVEDESSEVPSEDPVSDSDVSEEESEDVSKETSKDTSKETSKETSKVTSTATSSAAADDEGGNTGLIIGIVAVVVVIIAAAVVIVLKKKKA